MPAATTGAAGPVAQGERDRRLGRDDDDAVERDQQAVRQGRCTGVGQLHRQDGVHQPVGRVDGDDGEQQPDELPVAAQRGDQRPGVAGGEACGAGVLRRYVAMDEPDEQQRGRPVDDEDRGEVVRGEQRAERRADDRARVADRAGQRDALATPVGRQLDRHQGTQQRTGRAAGEAADRDERRQRPQRRQRDGGAHQRARDEQRQGAAAQAEAVADRAAGEVAGDRADPVGGDDQAGLGGGQAAVVDQVEREEEPHQRAGGAEELPEQQPAQPPRQRGQRPPHRWSHLPLASRVE